MKKTIKRMTAAQRREVRNRYSREWKAKHKKEVKMWNKAWYDAKKKAAKARQAKRRTKIQPEVKAA